MAGLLDDRKKSQYLQMAEEKLQGLLNLPQQAQRFITNPTAFLGLLSQNPLPRESGFAAGATGLPPTEMSVLDPNQAAYMQGYGQGEPVGYAGMALPLAAPAAVATGKALAPKAGLLAENYMQRMGGLMPLEAYHGTPHNIQGKFDINKVGTGEGAQAYGHGMYFAENPSVAGEYAKNLSNRDITNQGRLNAHANAQRLAALAGDPKYAADDIKFVLESNPNHEQKKLLTETLGYLESGAYKNPLETTGNLYKVDIPDKDIPNMLDWDKPLSKQTPEVQEALKKMGSEIKFGSNKESVADFVKLTGNLPPYFQRETGHGIYSELSKQLGGDKQASEYLNSLGIKGTRYLDQQSRGKSGTSNFVVFDPSTVKILEKNKKKVEGLLD